MTNIKKVTRLIFIFSALTVILLYFSYLTILPNIINTPKNIHKYEAILSERTSLNIQTEGFRFKPKTNLTFDIYINKFNALSSKKENLIQANKFKYNASIFRIKKGKLDIDYIFADINLLKKYFNNKNTSPKTNLSFFPVINIKKGKIFFTSKTYAEIKKIKSKKHFGEITTEIQANIISPYTKHPVKIGKEGLIKYKNKFKFENFSIEFGTSKILLSTEKDLKIKGESLPIKELEEGFLYFYKLKHPGKKNFIENFSNFKGTMDIDLSVINNGFWGKCITHNLGANFSTLNIPVFLPETVFYFKDKTIKAETNGTFGTEPVQTDVAITGVGTEKLDVLGTVKSTFTNRLVQKYYPNVEIQGHTPAKVTYHTHNGIVDVYYYLTIPKGSNLLSYWGNLDNIEKTRRMTMHTEKHDTPMAIKDFEYCAGEEGECQKLLFGDGLIDKINGKYTLYNLNIRSNGKIPVNYIKSFLRDYVKNGEFDADIKLDFIQKNMRGSMNLYDVSHADFLFLKNTNVNVNKDKITFNTNGTFYNSPIIASAIANNKFENNTIVINSIDMHLNSLFLQKGKLQSIPKTFTTNKKISNHKINKNKKPDIEIEQGRVIVDRVYGRRFDVRNVNIQGSLKNNMANFIVPKAQYAKGLLSAKGIYNVKNHSSDIEFFASDIDSNEVATHIFRLPDQIEGKAFATLHVITKNKFNDIKAKATFAVSNGFLPKIGNQEFMLNKNPNKKQSKITKFIEKHNIKLTLSNITNIDFSKPNIFYSNLYGSFGIDNEKVNNVRIFSKSNYLGLYIEGCYDTENEYGDIKIFGKRNKTEAKKIRIFKIPINLIYRVVFRPEHSAEYYEDKVKLIPQIKAGIADDISIFRVSVKGNFNKSENVKIELKDIR